MGEGTACLFSVGSPPPSVPWQMYPCPPSLSCPGSSGAGHSPRWEGQTLRPGSTVFWLLCLARPAPEYRLPGLRVTHTCTHTRAHTHLHKYTHMLARAHTRSYVRTQTYTYVLTCTHPYMLTHTPIHACAHTLTQCTHTYTYTHAHTHAHACTRAHAHTHSRVYSPRAASEPWLARLLVFTALSTGPRRHGVPPIYPRKGALSWVMRGSWWPPQPLNMVWLSRSAFTGRWHVRRGNGVVA